LTVGESDNTDAAGSCLGLQRYAVSSGNSSRDG